MAAIGRKIIRVYPLKGMDLRWTPDPRAATLVQDMVYDQRSGWRNCGGFRVVLPESQSGGSPGGDGTDPDPDWPEAPTGWETTPGGN